MFIPNQDYCDQNEEEAANRFNHVFFFDLQDESALSRFLGLSLRRMWRLVRHRNREVHVYERLTPGRLLVTPQGREIREVDRARTIQKPSNLLKDVQRRIKDELNQVALPDYLKSPGRGHSNIENALIHRNRGPIAVCDIEQFYHSIKFCDVYNTFLCRFQCSHNVAFILANLCCYNGRLMTGAPTSPLVAFMVMEECFLWIFALHYSANSRVSIWSDNITISGVLVFDRHFNGLRQRWRNTINDVETCLVQEGRSRFMLNHEKSKIYRPGKHATITGIIVTEDGELRMPNRLHLYWYTLKELAKTQTGEERARTRQCMKALSDYRRRIYQANFPRRPRNS